MGALFFCETAEAVKPGALLLPAEPRGHLQPRRRGGSLPILRLLVLHSYLLQNGWA
jgi:hypothetical protein